MTRISSDGAAVVDESFKWRPIDLTTPKRVKIQLINITEGVAEYGRIKSHRGNFWTHWAPLPSFNKERNAHQD